jgi:hypothetical protein
MQPYPRNLLLEEDITSHSIKPLTENYLQLSKKESAKERRWHWVRSVEEDREIMTAIEAEQSSTEEKLTFLKWLALQEGEVMNIDCSKWGLTTGRGWLGCEEDFQDWYIPILEEMEVTSEGDKWGEEVEQLHQTMDRSFGSGRDPWMRHARNFTMSLSCKVVKKGPKYWTAQADNELGKIYIPREIIPRWLAVQCDAPCFHVPPLSTEVTFTGFPACRGRKMPWRAVFVEKK